MNPKPQQAIQSIKKLGL